MVLKLDGDSEIGAQVRINLCYLICLRHLIRSRAVTNRIFSTKSLIFLHACATRSRLPSNTSAMGESDISGTYSSERLTFFNFSQK